MKFTGENDVFFGLKIFRVLWETPETKVVSGALRDGFRAREVFGSFETHAWDHFLSREPGIFAGPETGLG